MSYIPWLKLITPNGKVNFWLPYKDYFKSFQDHEFGYMFIGCFFSGRKGHSCCVKPNALYAFIFVSVVFGWTFNYWCSICSWIFWKGNCLFNWHSLQDCLGQKHQRVAHCWCQMWSWATQWGWLLTLCAPLPCQHIFHFESMEPSAQCPDKHSWILLYWETETKAWCPSPWSRRQPSHNHILLPPFRFVLDFLRRLGCHTPPPIHWSDRCCLVHMMVQWSIAS